MPASPFLYFADERLSTAELTAARLDGHLVELGDAFIPADAVETPGLRAGSLRDTLGDSLAASHLTAAWVHGALPVAPVRHTVQRAVDRRLHHVFGIRLLYRDGRIPDDDLQLVGGVRVTSPARTLADLARVPDDAHTAAAHLLAGSRAGLAHDAIAWLDAQGPLPHKRTAVSLLRAIAADAGATTT